MARYLIVANQTLGGDPLVNWIDERIAAEEAFMRFAVPVTDIEGTHQWDYPPIDRAVPDAHTIARTLAEVRLQNELDRLRHKGVEASGDVVDANPVEHVRTLLAAESFDLVVVCTLPRRLSRWLHTDLLHRLQRAIDVQVHHLEGSAGPSI